MIICYCNKKSIFNQKKLSDQELDHSNFSDAAMNRLQNIEPFDFYWLYVEFI